MLRRDDRQDRREERHGGGPGAAPAGGGPTHYQMRQKMFAIAIAIDEMAHEGR